MASLVNLDYVCARHARQMVERFDYGTSDRREPVEDEDRRGRPDVLITDALGVLQEQGVYACILFLSSRKEKNARDIEDALWDVLRSDELRRTFPDVAKITSTRDRRNFYLDVLCCSLDDLWLVRDLYEQMLIYARYGAKAYNSTGAASA